MTNVEKLSPKAPTWIVRELGILELKGTVISVRLDKQAHEYAIYIGDERWSGSVTLAKAKEVAEEFHEELLELKIIEA
jgi:hypothetical protein